MPSEELVKVWIYVNFVLGVTRSARPRFDTSTDMGMVLVPADAEIESVIFRLRATDQDADFPLVFDVTATVAPVVRVENLPCTLYNKICQANVILTKRLTAGRLHDFAIRVKDSKGDTNSMQATISVTNATTQRDKIFPHIPSIIMVPEDTKPGKELDYVLARANQWSGKPVYIELWQPKELFTIRQRQTPIQTRGVIILIDELDFETQSMYTLTMYATDPYTEPKKDTRNIAGLHLVVIVQDVQDVPPIFTHAPPLTKLNNTIQPGDVILRVHAEDGDKGVPREVTYGLVSEGNPFTTFFNISESTGEITLAKSLEELTQITHVGAPVVLSVVAEEIRRSTNEPPAQATVVEVGLLLGEPGNTPPYFENENYVAWMDENPEPGSLVVFGEAYSTRVKDEDIGKAGVFALKLENNNGTFEISPTVAERSANFIVSVRDNTLIDYEVHKSLRFKIVAQEVGPATNLSASVPVMIFLRDVNDNPPEFQETPYEITLSENITAGTRVIQVHATDKDTGSFGRIQYTQIIGPGSEAFVMNSDTGVISVAVDANHILDREIIPQLQLTIEARDEDGKGLKGSVPLIINLLDVNDNAPIFEKDIYDFIINGDLTNFTVPAIIKATDVDAEQPNNEVRYELIHGNYENYFLLDEVTGELFISKQIMKPRTTRQNPHQALVSKFKKTIFPTYKVDEKSNSSNIRSIPFPTNHGNQSTSENKREKFIRRKRHDSGQDVLFTLTARAYDLGVPHLSSTTQVNILQSLSSSSRIVMFVVAGEKPDPVKTAQTLATITGGHIIVKEIRPYVPGSTITGLETTLPSTDGVKRSIVVARVEPTGGTLLVDIDKIRAVLAANGVGVIGGDMPSLNVDPRNNSTTINTNNTITSVHSEEVTVYRAENQLLFWLLILLGLLILAVIIALIVCCICPGCPFYMEPRKRRIHSPQTLIARSDGRPKRHLHRKYPMMTQDPNWSEKKQAWSADPMRSTWQFNRRNTKQYGLASLPGDVMRIPDSNYRLPRKAMSLKGDLQIPIPIYDPLYSLRQQEEHRIYMENIERAKEYDAADVDSLRKHEFERGSDLGQQLHGAMLTRRDHHFYREGNAEVMRLVTRNGVEETLATMHRPPEIIIDQAGGHKFDGKDILLRRFIEDQKLRAAGKEYQDGLQEDFEQQSMESHQRQQEITMQQQQEQQQQQPHQQREILMIPEKLEVNHRQHLEQLGPDVQRLIIDHTAYEKHGRSEMHEYQDFLTGATLLIPMGKPPEKSKETSSVNLQNYTVHDLELATQNVLLTRILLERDGRVGAGVVDPASYLETQSLPGQVATGTQTDQTATIQGEHQSKSRSDNESEEESKIRKKMKFLKRYGEEPKRIRTLWMKSPIQEEIRQYPDKYRAVSRRKMKEVKEGRQISIEPEVLREISDSLEENTDLPPKIRKALVSSNSQYESREEEEIPRTEESSSVERKQGIHKKETREKRREKEEKRKKITKLRGDSASGPSFRILEKEMNSLSRKLSKLTGRKTSSEEDSGEREKVSHAQQKCEKSHYAEDQEKKTKKVESKSGRKNTQEAIQSVTKQHMKIQDPLVGDKFKQKSKLRKTLSISTASSEWEESGEKSVMKSITQAGQEIHKLKLPMGKTVPAKLRRQEKIEWKDAKKCTKKKLAKSETKSIVTKSSSSVPNHVILSDKPVAVINDEGVFKAPIRLIDDQNKSLTASSSVIREFEKPQTTLRSDANEYSHYGDAPAPSTHELEILKSPQTSKSLSSTTDVGSMGLEYSDRRSVGSSPDTKSITPTQGEESSVRVELRLESPDTTDAITPEINATHLKNKTNEIPSPVTKNPRQLNSLSKKKTTRKRVRIAEEKYEEKDTPKTLTVNFEQGDKIQINKNTGTLKEYPSDGEMDFNDRSITSTKINSGGDENDVKTISETIISSPSDTNIEGEKTSITKSPRTQSLTISSVQNICAVMDGIIEEAKTLVSRTMKTVKTTTNLKDSNNGAVVEKISEIKTEVPEKDEVIKDSKDDVGGSSSVVINKTQIVSQSTENTSSEKMGEIRSKVKNENPEDHPTKNILEKMENTGSNVLDTVQRIIKTAEPVIRIKLDRKMSTLNESEDVTEEKTREEEITANTVIQPENVNAENVEMIKLVREDLTDILFTKIEEKMSDITSGTSTFSDSTQRLMEENIQRTGTEKLPSSVSLESQTENGKLNQHKLNLDHSKKSPSVTEPTLKNQPPAPSSSALITTSQRDSQITKESLTGQQTIESAPFADITVTSNPVDLSVIPIHHGVSILTNIVGELNSINDSLEPLEPENVESISIKSEGSQSSKSMIIVRETSFLSSPKREFPKKDDSIAEIEKKAVKIKGDTFGTMTENTQLRVPTHSEMLIPNAKIRVSVTEFSTETSDLKIHRSESENIVSVSEDIHVPTIEKLQQDIPSIETATGFRDVKLLQECNINVAVPKGTFTVTTENIQTDTPTPSGISISDLAIKSSISEISTELLDVQAEEKKQEHINIPELSLEKLEEDSDVSSQSSIRTTLVTQPYGTPRCRKLVHIDSIIDHNISVLPLPSSKAPMGEKQITAIVSSVSQIRTEESDISGEQKLLVPIEITSNDINSNKMENTAEITKDDNDEISIENREISIIREEEPFFIVADKQTASHDHNKMETEIEPNQVELISKTVQEILPDDGLNTDILPDMIQGATGKEDVKASDAQKTFSTIRKIVKLVPMQPLKKIDQIPKKLSMRGKLAKSECSREECKDLNISPMTEKNTLKVFPEGSMTKKMKHQGPEKLLPLETKSHITSDRLKISRKLNRDKEPPLEKFQQEKSKKSTSAIRERDTIMNSTKIVGSVTRVKQNHHKLSKLEIMTNSSASTEIEKKKQISTMLKSPVSSTDFPIECNEMESTGRVGKVTMVTSGENVEDDNDDIKSLATTISIETTVSGDNIEHRDKLTETERIHVSKSPDGTFNKQRQLIESSDKTTEAKKKDAKFLQDAKNMSSVTKESQSSVSKSITDLKSTDVPHTGHLKEDIPEAQSRYMAWYKAMHERKEGEDQGEPPKWLRKSTRQRWLKMGPEDRKNFALRTPDIKPPNHRKIRPSKNAQSEQLKAIVRQGRKLRRAEGGKNEEPRIEIFVPEKPPIPPSVPAPAKYHHLIQHSEYKYEKISPFYLHPPPVPHSSPQISPRPFEDPTESCSKEFRRPDEDIDSGIALSMSTGGRLRHQQLLEKKSVFDIAYSEAAPSHLRADSTTPPS